MRSSWRLGWQGTRRQVGMLTLTLVCFAALIGTLESSPASATPPTTAIRYVYDADGHLKAVINPATETALYGWDPAGNLTSIGLKSSTKLSIIQLAPAQGAVGETVTISGTGFSTTASSDTVKFNGTAATVSAATALSLTVKVPTGATSGTVTVQTTTEGPVTSAQSFTVASSSAPSVTSLSASVVANGGSLTISGKNFETNIANDVVTINETRANVTSATSTSLTVTVPEATEGGHVYVATPQGIGTGPDLYIPPDGLTTSQIGPTSTLSLGSSTTLKLTTAGKYGLAIFEGTKGQSVSFTFPETTIAEGTLSVWGPEGVEVIGGGFASGWTHYLLGPFTLPATGAYTIMVAPRESDTGSIKIAGYSVVNVTGEIKPTTEGAVTEVSLPTPGQEARYKVPVTAGEAVSLKAVVSLSEGYELEWLNPEGVKENGWEGGSTGSEFLTFGAAVTGTYTLVVNPREAATGSIKLTAYNATAVTGTITPSSGGGSKTVTTTVPGQQARITFSGTEKERLSLLFAEKTGSMKEGSVQILNPAGEVIPGGSSGFGGSEFVETVTLPVTGTYTILIAPRGEEDGSIKMTAYTVTNVTGEIVPTTTGTVTEVSLPTPGQEARYRVPVTAGEAVSLKAVLSLSGGYEFEWLNPEGVKENGWEGGGTGSEFLGFGAAVTGTYTLVVNPREAATGSISLTAYNATPVTGTITPSSEGEAKTFTTKVPGQAASITFPGTEGEQISVNFSEMTFSEGKAWILNPKGEVVSGGETAIASVWGELVLEPATLPVTGTYTILIAPRGEETGSIKITAYTGSHHDAIRKPASLQGLPTLTTPIDAVAGGTNTGVTQFASLQSARAASQTSLLASNAKTIRLPSVYASRSLRTGSRSRHDVASSGKMRLIEGHSTSSTRKVAKSDRDRQLKKSLAARLAVGRFLPLGPTAWSPPSPRSRGSKHAWITGESQTPWAKVAPLQALYGTTSLAGQVLAQNGLPITDVRVSIAGTSIATDTDEAGRFLLNGGVPAGHQVLVVEGNSTQGHKRYGIYEVGVDLSAHKRTILPYTIWLTPLNSEGDHSIASPTKQETRLTTPQIPGLEVRLPKGTVITDANGHTVKKLNITAVPVDRPPFPLPMFVSVPLYFTVQPGRAYLSKGAQIIYPNWQHLPPGQRVDFWNYDAAGRGWYVYGQGTVTPDGKQVVPDPQVKIWEFTGAMTSEKPIPPTTSPAPGASSTGGDPVDLHTGLFVYHKTDLVLPGTIPIVIERTYRQSDPNSYGFGIGMTEQYELRLWSTNREHEIYLVLPNGGKVRYLKTSPGGYAEGDYTATNSPGLYYGSTLKYWGGLWELSLTDGLTYEFPSYAPLQGIHDRYGNKLTITRTEGALGNIKQITAPYGRWVAFTYDGSNRVTEIKDNGGRTVKYGYNTAGTLEKVTDPAGRVTKYEYNASNQMTAVKDGRGKTYVETEYESHGRVAKQTLGDAGVYKFAYTENKEGQVEATIVTDPRKIEHKTTFNTEGFPTSEISALGTSIQQTTTFEPEAGSGLLLSTTDPRGRKTTFQYDSYGNMTKKTLLAGTASAQTTEYKYEPGTTELASETDPLKHTTTYKYGPKGERLSETDPLGHKTGFEYDAEGQVTLITNPLGKSTKLTYTDGDLTSVTDPLNRTTKQFVDAVGRVGSVTTPGGQRTVYEYNADDQTTKITDPLGNETSYEYDGDGDLTAVTDPNKHKTTMTYDPMDRLEGETDPLEHTTKAVHDQDGNITELTDRRGKLTKFTYDSLNRLTEAKFGVSGETAESMIKYEYDNGNRLTKVIDSVTGTFTPEYDELNRLKSLATPNGTIKYEYDEANRRTSMTVSGQEAVKYTYDEANRLKELTRGTQKVSFAYNEANYPTKTTLVDGIEEQYGYDAASELTSIAYKKGSTTLGELDYSYNPNSGREAVWGSYARTGLPEAISSATYNADNEQTERNSKKLSYDANGNLTSDGTNEYKWNARNQLSAITGGTAASFEYDPFGRRISKTIGGTTTKVLYDEANAIQETKGTATANLLTGLSPDQTLARTTSSGTESLLTDALGSTIALAGSTAKAETAYTYEPFGNTSKEGTASENPFQYAGREDDGDGLYYNRARYYSPADARFISQDPLGQEAGGPDLYIYTADSPINTSDPFGTESIAEGINKHEAERKKATEEASEPEVPTCKNKGENPPIVGPTGTSNGAPTGTGGPGGDGASQGPGTKGPPETAETPGGHNPRCNKTK
jgi:RHS repeat-associated protein